MTILPSYKCEHERCYKVGMAENPRGTKYFCPEHQHLRPKHADGDESCVCYGCEALELEQEGRRKSGEL